MGIVLNQLIGQFETMEKKALAKIAEDPMGNENSAELTGVPGAEHDVNVPAEAKKPDPEVAQGQPADAASTEGAVPGGDAKPLEEGKLEIDEPALNPDEKPMVTDEAYAKEASEKVAALVNDLLAGISAPAQKQAAAKKPETKEASAKKGNPEKAATEKAAKAKKSEIVIDDATISKLAAAISVYKKGQEAGEKVAAAADKEGIRQACIKLAQDQGLNPEAAAAAADAAMADPAAAPAEAAAEAPAEAAAEAAAGAESTLPEDVTPQELGEAIVELVEDGQLDTETAKAIIDELASADAGGADISEDEAAQIVADGLESGQITPEQAEAIAAEIEGGGAPAPAPAPAASEAEAAGAADADAALADAADEAAGAAAAEEAMKQASAMIEAKKPFLAKVAEKLEAKVAEKKAAATPLAEKVAKVVNEKRAADNAASDEYARGFTKRAKELGVDPQQLARYALDRMGNK